MTTLDSNIINNFLQETVNTDKNPIVGVLTSVFNEAMKIERENALNAKAYERNQERNGYANGFKNKTLKTRAGDLKLNVPQVRNHPEGFYPSVLTKGMRSEKALMLTISEMYINGISTRKVSKILKEMGLEEISSTTVSNFSKNLDEGINIWRERELGEFHYVQFDALYEKTRIDKSVVSNAVLVAYGVDNNGIRSVLGVSTGISEAEIHWRTFFKSLIKRGLHGVRMITSDAHAGLKSAIKTCFPGVAWQRCHFHLQQNASAFTKSKTQSREIAEDIRTIFNAPNKTEALRYLDQLLEKYKTKIPKFVTWAEEAILEGLTFFDRPKEHWKKIRTSNMAERVNKEIRRRTKVVGIFPNDESLIRLVASILMERDETWAAEERKYLNITKES